MHVFEMMFYVVVNGFPIHIITTKLMTIRIWYQVFCKRIHSLSTLLETNDMRVTETYPKLMQMNTFSENLPL